MESSQQIPTPVPGQRIDLELTDSGYTIRRVCQDRFAPPAGSKDITLHLVSYFPFEELNTETYVALNLTGWKLGDVEIRSRTVYPSYDGKRLVLEVGCNTVIYLQISSDKPEKHHHFFIESHQNFLMDITTRAVAAHVSHVAAPMETIAKFEIFFLMGMFSTVSLAVWLAVTGSDLTFTAVSLRHKSKLYGKLAKTLLEEKENIKQYSPTLHKKLMELLTAEGKRLANKTAKKIPQTVVNDEKAQAQTGGILFGKAVLSPKMLTVWGALITVLIQAVSKSFSDTPSAFIKVIDDRYASIVRELANTDWADIQDRQNAIIKLIDLFKENKISVSREELESIIKEVHAHPKELQATMLRILEAFKEFKLKTS